MQILTEVVSCISEAISIYFEPQNKYATEMKSKMANGHCGGGEFCPNVSIAPAADPAEFEGGEVGGEGVITKRCFVLLSDDGTMDDDG